MDHPNNGPQDQDFDRAGILIVDENPESRTALVEILAPCNYRLEEVKSAQETLTRLHSDEFAVLLIDVVMPQMSGLELASIIKKQEPAGIIPIIFLITENIDVKQIYKSYRSGATDYLVKPLIPEVVRAKVAVFVELFVQKREQKRLRESITGLNNELKEAKEKIRRLRRTYKMVLDSAGEGIYGVDSQGILTFINQSGAQILGYTTDELIGKPSHTIWHHHRLDGQLYSQKECPIFASYKSGKRHSGEDVFWKKDGTKIPVLLSSNPLIVENEIVGAVATFTDITEHKKVEEELRLSEARFRTLFEQATLSIQILDPEGRSIEVNRSYEMLWGLTLEMLKDYNILEDKQLIAKGIMPYIRKGFAGEASEIPIVLYDPSEINLPGKPRWVKGYIFPVKNKKGEIIQIVLMHVDVTELTLKENALRESRQQLQAIMDNSPTAIYMKDLQGRYMLVNRKTEKIFGIDKQEVIGKKDEDVFPSETAEIVRTNDKNVLESGVPIELEEIIPLKDGFHTYISTKYPLMDASGKPYAICGISTDITERKKAEGSLRRYSEELSAANKELEAFSYSVSHDLKNPLNTISGFVQILSEDYWESIDGNGRDYLKRIAQGTDKMRSIINNLLNFSRIEKQKIRREEIDLSEMTRRIISDLHYSQPKKRVHVIIQQGIKANADSQMLNIVLTNLLNNAWKYTSKKENPQIEVGTMKEGDKTVYFVSDNGAGFDMKLADRLFVPFQRLHAEKEYTGTGIGLAIVERVIKKHGGRVWAESEVGKGATFYFTLG
jgi:PAS domain S-box-containing protein